jgi:hypothetical protein
VGVPVCTYLDEDLMRARYPQSPPVLNCRSEAEVVETLGGLVAEPQRCRALGERARAWIKRYHAAADVVAAQVELYADLCPLPAVATSREER